MDVVIRRANDCDDQIECTVDRCDPAQGCQASPVADGTDCGDAFCVSVSNAMPAVDRNPAVVLRLGLKGSPSGPVHLDRLGIRAARSALCGIAIGLSSIERIGNSTYQVAVTDNAKTRATARVQCRWGGRYQADQVIEFVP